MVVSDVCPFDEKAPEIDHVDLRTRVVFESAADDPGTTQLAVRIGGMVMTTDDCPSVRVAYRAGFRLFVDGQWWSRWSRWVRCEGGADRIDACQYNLHALGLGAARTSFPAGQGPDPFVVEMDVGVRAFDAAMNVREIRGAGLRR